MSDSQSRLNTPPSVIFSVCYPYRFSRSISSRLQEVVTPTASRFPFYDHTPPQDRKHIMFAHEIRSSKGFVILVVCVAYFTDMLLSNLIVPILPYALLERVGLPEKDVQKWNSILLALYGGSQAIGSCTSRYHAAMSLWVHLCLIARPPL